MEKREVTKEMDDMQTNTNRELVKQFVSRLHSFNELSGMISDINAKCVIDDIAYEITVTAKQREGEDGTNEGMGE